MDSIRQNILTTVAYFDVFDLPLKAEEVFGRLVNFRHLQVSGVRCQVSDKKDQESSGVCNLEPKTCNLSKIQRELDQLVLDRTIDIRGGYYFLYDREYLVPLRAKRDKIAKRKWRIAKRAIWWLRFVPFVRAVFASGSLAMSNTDELSDLDVLIVVKHGKIWLTRFLISGLLSLLRVRRRGHDKIAPDKICLNHYITDESLAINFQSIYNAQTYANLVPMYVSDPALIENFKKANGWVLGYVFGWNFNSTEVKPQRPYWGARLAEKLLNVSRLSGFLEKRLRQYQSRRIGSNPEIHQPGGRIVFNDDQLEFHPRSIEAEVIKKYNENLVKLGLADLAVEQDSGLIKPD